MHQIFIDRLFGSAYADTAHTRSIRFLQWCHVYPDPFHQTSSPYTKTTIASLQAKATSWLRRQRSENTVRVLRQKHAFLGAVVQIAVRDCHDGDVADHPVYIHLQRVLPALRTERQQKQLLSTLGTYNVWPYCFEHSL